MEEKKDEAAAPAPVRVPPRYAELVQQWGPPVGVEEARTRWGQLVAAAEGGAVVLVTLDTTEARGYPTWAALAPLDKVADPGRCPVWPLTSARPKLAEVIADATRFPAGAPQVLTRHRRPVAAVVAAVTLVDLPPDGERIDVDAFLREGGTITLEFDPGQDGATDPEGEVLQEPIPAGYIARAKQPDGSEVGQGEGDSVAEAMLRLWRPPAHLYSAEPPFPDGWSPQPDTDPWAPDSR
ncbi:hypothetical protein [Streptomyces sp. NPDC020983]|uniref:hypothetical protein n=1 Tax=Streptomyces sp. NPDC020983 TaxID=3365106 RepID=UPI0037A112A5